MAPLFQHCFSAPNFHFLGVLPSNGERDNRDQNFLNLCFELPIPMKDDIEPFRPGAGSWDPMGWLPPAVSSLFQIAAQKEQ